MEQVHIVSKGNGFEQIVSLPPDQANLGKTHACRISQREFQQARDRLKRANRDLGETAAFIAAALTTATAVQAVIGFVDEKLGLSQTALQVVFMGYILVIVSIVVFGTLRVANAMYRRKQAERQIDQTKKGIFDFCPVEEWSKAEE